jgi:hypothetical protein
MTTQLLKTPSTHSWSLVAGLDTGMRFLKTLCGAIVLTPSPPVWNSVRDTFIGLGWGPVASLAEAAVTSYVVPRKMPLALLNLWLLPRLVAFSTLL